MGLFDKPTDTIPDSGVPQYTVVTSDNGRESLTDHWNKLQNSSILKEARLLQYQGGSAFTDAHRRALQHEAEVENGMRAQSKEFEANQKAQLDQEEAARVSSDGAIANGGWAYQWELELEGIQNPKERVSRARQIISESYDESTPLGAAYLKETHPEHKQAVRAVANATRLSLLK